MTLTDQQLRQELISYGETVPPITQRNREQLRARLELLQSRTRTRTPASPSRSHATASPSKSRAAASPSRARTSTASPSRTPAAASPSRTTRATLGASPSRSLATSSPARNRSSVTNNSATSRRSTRSQQPTGLIELSDSDTDAASRSTGAGQASPTMQTRSGASRRQRESPTASPKDDIAGPAAMYSDVEQSIARHRREIKQLLDSARDRNRVTQTSSPSHSGQRNEPTGTPLHPTSKTRSHRQPSKLDDANNEEVDDDKVKKSPKSVKTQQQEKQSCCKHIGESVKSIWGQYGKMIKTLLKIFFISAILVCGATSLSSYLNLAAPRQPISCSVKNATTCEDMKQVIVAVRKQLQVRTGEVDCGFRAKPDVLVPRSEIENYLNEKGLKFNLGNEERWNSLITYILHKPIKDILLWDEKDKPTNNPVQVKKLSTQEAARTLACRIQQDTSPALRNIILLTLGSIGLITLAWLFQRRTKTNKANEKTFQDILDKATNLLKEQYEQHVKNPKTQPWLAINHLREKIISKEDQQKLKDIWERVKKHISKDIAQFSSETQEINGEHVDVWRWLKSSSPKKSKAENTKNSADEAEAFDNSEVGLTECLKLRNCFQSDNYADSKELDNVIESIQKRCAHVKRIDHIGIHSAFVYLKFSSKEAAAQGYHLLNNWNYKNRTINVKYIRLTRYYEHFPEARGASPK